MPAKTNVLISVSTNLVDWTPHLRIIAFGENHSLSNISIAIENTGLDRCFYKVE